MKHHGQHALQWLSARRRVLLAALCGAFLASPPTSIAQHQEQAIVGVDESGLPKVGEPFRDCPECPLMVRVPTGSLQMRNPERDWLAWASPMREVSLSEPLAVGVYEVTFAEWDAAERDALLMHRPSDEGWGRGRRPVVNVGVNDVELYVEWLSQVAGQSYRLLNEHEWEYAASGGVAADRYWGDDEADQCRHANGADRSAIGRYSGLAAVQCDDGHATTAPVGSYAPNAFGLHDVLGNVSEWTGSCGIDDCEFMASVRGGSWLSAPRLLRTLQRYDNHKGARNHDIGFRVARTFSKKETSDE